MLTRDIKSRVSLRITNILDGQVFFSKQDDTQREVESQFTRADMDFIILKAI